MYAKATPPCPPPVHRSDFHSLSLHTEEKYKMLPRTTTHERVGLFISYVSVQEHFPKHLQSLTTK